MHTEIWRRLGGLLFIALLGSGLARADTVVIGQCAPLSGSLASTGQAMALGVRIAIDAANAAGGVNGHTLKHVLKDDGYQTAETLRLTQELIRKDKAAALIGYAGTGNIAELLKQGVLSTGGIALVAPYTGGEPLRSPFNPWIFHIRASYGDETEAMVRQFVGTGVTRIARDYHQALKRFAPEDTPSYTSFEEYVGARVLIEAIRRSKGTPTPAAVMQSLENLDLDLGGFKLRFGPGERVGSRYVEVTLLGRDGNHVR